MRNYLLLGCVAILMANSCSKKSGSVAPPGGTNGKDVYVAGVDYSGTHPVASSWKNGTATAITNGTKNAMAFALAVSGSDVYVAGYENNDTVNVAKIWKNGVATSLQQPIDTTRTTVHFPWNSYASGIAVSGTDVYAAGGVKWFSPDESWIWKNGQTVPFTYGTPPAYDTKYFFTGIAVSGTTIYLAGNEDPKPSYSTPYIAKYWKKTDGNILLQAVALTDGSKNAEAHAITLSGNDVYVAGFENYDKNGVGVAKYWKNGVAVALTDGTNDAEANAIVVIGTDVYIAGYENNGNIDVAKYWKNGVAVALTDGRSGDAEATGIAVSGSDVHVIGNEGNNTNVLGRYWKNGIAIAFNGGKAAQPFAITLGN